MPQAWKYAIADGALIGARTWPEDSDPPPLRDGLAYIESDADILDPSACIVVDGAIVARAIPIDDCKADKWAKARAYRNARQEGGCQTPLGIVDTDPDSQRKINGAATAILVARASGQNPPPVQWTMKSNAVVTHSPAQMLVMGLAVVEHINACQIAATAVRTAIMAALTRDEVEAIDITAGYPA